MASTTRIGAAQDALKTALDGRAALSGVQRDLGFPQEAYPEPDHVWIAGDIEDWTQVADITGPDGVSAERFTLRVFCHAERDTFTAARNRALALAAEVEAAIRADPTLGGSVAVAEVIGGDAVEGVRDDHRQFRLRIGIACQADLTA